MMGFAHKHAITRFMTGRIFGLRRDPMAFLEVVPLCLTLASGGLKCRFDLQYQALNP
jgi:hypothetical protein